MSKTSQWSKNKKIAVSVMAGVVVIVIFIIAFNVAPNNSGIYAKEGVFLLPDKYNEHYVVETTDEALIAENKLPVFNDTLLNLNAVPLQIEFTFTREDNTKYGAVFEFLPVKYDEARLSKELGGLPLYDKDGTSIIFYQWNPNLKGFNSAVGNQYLFKNAADGLWYLSRWPHMFGEPEEYLPVLATYAG